MDNLLTIATLILMGLSLLLIVVPVVPVSALEWGIAIIYAVGTGFERVSPAAAIFISVLMVIGSTSGLWMPFFGLRGKQLSCMGLIAFFVGMLIGTAIIPVPLIGSIIGGMLAVVIIEFARDRDAQAAWKSGGSALKLMLYGMMAELLFAGAIVATVVISILNTA